MGLKYTYTQWFRGLNKHAHKHTQGRDGGGGKEGWRRERENFIGTNWIMDLIVKFLDSGLSLADTPVAVPGALTQVRRCTQNSGVRPTPL